MSDASEQEKDGFTRVEVWAAVNEAGDYAISQSIDDLKDAYEDQIGEWDGQAVRVIKLSVNVPTPKPLELSATVADEPAAGELKAA